MENMELYEKCRAVPDDAKKEIKGGRMSGMTNINAMWRLKMLTEMFDRVELVGITRPQTDGWRHLVMRSQPLLRLNCT